jgi:opacity protein-like surface antigen
MRKPLLIASLTLLLALAAAPTFAQGYFAPFVGYDFGGDAGACPSILNDCSEKKASYGLAAGALAGGVFGFEEDFSYAPDFFGASSRFGDNSVLTLMSNVVVGIPIGGVRPYVSAGLGLMRTRVTFDLASLGSGTSQNALGYNIGGGLMIFFPHHLGLRADYRNLRSTKDISILGIDIANTKLSFSRVSIGLVLH